MRVFSRRNVVAAAAGGTLVATAAKAQAQVFDNPNLPPTGAIVNIASIAGKDGNPHVAAYVASKAGVIGLTKSAGKELARTGVLVNAIAPSASETAIFGELTDESRKRLLANVPMARMVLPAEVAELAVWLASPACSFSTGATFDISGGRATY